MELQRAACLGGGLIGASWTALFLASGRSVTVFDPDPAAEKRVRDYIETAWPIMAELGLAENGAPDDVAFVSGAAEAVDGAGFIQESVPERLALKRAVFAEIEPVLSAEAVVASSASGLTLTQMQAGWRNPSRMVLGHPFNPPHLIPLVEIAGNEKTESSALEAAERFYESLGKITIRLNREVPGHVANRLQAAVWREAIHLVLTGVTSVEDVDKAMWAGPGLRWAAMGPTLLFSLGAGEGGLRGFCDHFSDTFNGWWDDLGEVRLTDEVAERLAVGVEEEAKGMTHAELSMKRDAMISAILQATRPMREDR